MAARQAPRRSRTVVIVVAAVWLLFGLLLLVSALRSRFALGPGPPAPPGPVAPITTVTRPAGEPVVVALVDLKPGDLLTADLVELRPAGDVIRQFPSLGPAEAPAGEEMLPGYLHDIEQLEGKYLAVAVQADMPIPAGAVQDHSPLAHPLDPLRIDRFTVVLPSEPTLYQHLKPGDRVDVVAVLGDQAVSMLAPQARIIAIGQMTAAGAGIGREEAAYHGGRYEAAKRKRQRLEQMRRQQRGEPEPPPEEQAAETESGQAPAAPAGSEAEQAERQQEARTLTLEVTPDEAHLLAAAHRTVGVRLDFALHPRP